MRGRAWLAIGLPALLLSLATVRASWAAPPPIYLPFVLNESRLAPPEPCAPPEAAEQRCPGQAGWTLACGGIGQVRDLVDLGQDGTLLAVGDGAARITPEGLWSAQMGQALVGLEAADRARIQRQQVAVAVGDQAQILSWQSGCWTESPPAYFDESLTYRDLQLTRYPFTTELYGWAAGREDDQGDPGQGAGWAAVASLAPSSLEAWSEWRDPVRRPDLRRLPPLHAVRTLWRFGNGQYLAETWLLGAQEAADQGVFVRADRLDEPAPVAVEDGQLPTNLLRHVSPRGEPMAYALGLQRPSGSLGWRYQAAAHGWQPEPSLRRVDRPLADALIGQLVEGAEDAAPTDFWIAFRPVRGADASLVERIDWQSGVVTASYGAPPLPGPPPADAPIALGTRLVDGGGARKRLDGLLYSIGDDAWRWEAGRGAGDPGRWLRSRRRLDLAAFLPLGEGGLALAPTGSGGRLLRYAGGQLREDLQASGLLEGLPRLSLLAGQPGAIWLAGEAGTSVRLGGDLEQAEVFRLPQLPGLPPGADPRAFIDLAASASGEVWAASRQSREDGPQSQLWRFDRYSAAWRPVLDAPLPAAITSLGLQEVDAGSQAWAVGEGLALWVEPGCDGTSASTTGSMTPSTRALRSPSALRTPARDARSPETTGLTDLRPARDLEPDCRCHWPEGGRPNRVCRLDLPDIAMADVAPVAPGEAWAVGALAGAESLLRLSAGSPARVRVPITPTVTLSPTQPGGVGSGSRFTALAASEDEVWVATRCGRGAWRGLDPGPDRYRRIACGDDPPYYSAVLRFDGRGWAETPYPGGPTTVGTELNVPVRDIDLVDLGDRRRLWLAGDWTTLAYRDDAPGSP